MVVHPMRGSGNSKPRFLTSSAYNPPSAPKLMSSKKTPHIAGLIDAPGRSTLTVRVTAGRRAGPARASPSADKKRRRLVSMGYDGLFRSGRGIGRKGHGRLRDSPETGEQFVAGYPKFVAAKGRPSRQSPGNAAALARPFSLRPRAAARAG